MLYQERMRRVDDRMFTAFDFPDCGQVRAKRPVSTTPLQALNLMNSEFVLDQAKRIADRAAKDANGDQNKSVDRCFELLLGRKPSEQERADCLEIAKELMGQDPAVKIGRLSYEVHPWWAAKGSKLF